MSCSFNDDVDNFKTAVKEIVLLFQKDISKIVMEGDSSPLDNLYLAKEYVKGLTAILSSNDATSENVEKCIQEYKLLSENKGTLKDTNTSIAMYSDTIKINKLNLVVTIQMIIGIILVSLFLLNKEKIL